MIHRDQLELSRIKGTGRSAAKFYGIGVGPGDPELLTIKAVKVIQSADVISYICDSEMQSRARLICKSIIDTIDKSIIEVPIVMPMCQDRGKAEQKYKESAGLLNEQLSFGKQVTFLCEGDGLFYGSLNYIIELIDRNYPTEVIAGISSPHAASAALKQSLAKLDDACAIMSGRHDDEQITKALCNFESVIILKAGRSRHRIIKLIESCGRLDEACYVENLGNFEEKIIHDIRALNSEIGPYFSLFLITDKNGKCRD